MLAPPDSLDNPEDVVQLESLVVPDRQAPQVSWVIRGIKVCLVLQDLAQLEQQESRVLLAQLVLQVCKDRLAQLVRQDLLVKLDSREIKEVKV